MKIGIIGAGNIGSALAHRFGAVGHEVTIANSRGPASLAKLAQETGARAGTVEEAASGNDVVVVTIPLNKVPELPKGLFADASEDLIVIDTCNYYPRERDGRIDEIEAGLTESAWVARRLGHPVIKVFNSIPAPHLLKNGKPKGARGRIALPVGGNDHKAKAAVMGLVDQIGFDAVDAGTIEETWRQQPGSPSYVGDLDVSGLRQALAAARSERSPDFSGTANSPGTFASPV